MSATATRPVRDPRLHARRAAVARAAGHRRLSALALVAIAVALAVTGIVVAHSSVFAARHVTVVGNEHTSTAAVVDAAGLRSDPPLVDVGAGDARAVMRLPWIATATIATHFPDSVTVHVTERVAIATAPSPGHRLALLDARGRVLALVPAGATVASGLVALTGVGSPPRPGQRIGRRGLAALRAVAALPESLATRVTALVADPRLGLVAHLSNGATAELGGATDLAAKYVALATLLDRGVLAGAVRADLRVPSAPVLNP